MSNNTIYSNLSTKYYDFIHPTPSKVEYEFYRSYIADVKGPALEPMCGSGRFILPLLEEGFDVRGFDSSPQMLSALHKKATLKNLKPKVWETSFKDLSISEKYNLIFITAGSFSLINGYEKAELYLKKIYDILVDRGIFVFEVMIDRRSFRQPNIWYGFTANMEDRELIIANLLDLPIKNNIATTISKFELLNGEELVQTEIENLQVFLYDKDILLPLLKNIGFEDVRIIESSYNDTSKHTYEKAIFECRK